MSSKDGVIEIDGVVKELLPGSRFIIELSEEGFEGVEVEGHLGGKMRMNSIRVVKGDGVKLELAPTDITKGRIVYRYK